MKWEAFAAIVAVVATSGCAQTAMNHPDNLASCNFQAVQGKEFTFKEIYPGGRKLGYSSWSERPDIDSGNLSYYKYVGKSGKLTSQKLRSSNWSSFYYQRAILEDCGVVYVQPISRLNAKPYTYYPDVYFQSQVDQAKTLIGKRIWVNNTSFAGRNKLITDSREVSYPTYNTEPLTVIGLSFHSYGYATGIQPFFLKVRNDNGQQGLLGFNNGSFYRSNPVPKTTPTNVRTAIEQQRVFIGMNEKQVILSLGPPKHVNDSRGPWGIHEQWVYDSQYIYFENGRVTSLQDFH